MWYKLTKDEAERINQAIELKKYGALMSFKELFTYQGTVSGSHTHQVIEIAKWAARKNAGLPVILSLKDNPKEVVDKILDQKWTLSYHNDKVPIPVRDFFVEQTLEVFGVPA